MSNKDLRIELLYFDECPSWKNANAVLSESLQELGLDQAVTLVQVETQAEAERNEFTGSPMIKVNGDDLFPTGQENYALGCRMFQTPEGYQGWPTKDMVLSKLTQYLD